MRYVHIPLLLIVLFFGYVVFLLLKKRLPETQSRIIPGFIFYSGLAGVLLLFI